MMAFLAGLAGYVALLTSLLLAVRVGMLHQQEACARETGQVEKEYQASKHKFLAMLLCFVLLVVAESLLGYW